MLNDLLMAMLLGSGPEALFQGEHLSDTGLETAIVSYARTGDCDRARGHWHTLRARYGEAAPLLDEVLICMSDRARREARQAYHGAELSIASADFEWAKAVSNTRDQRGLTKTLGNYAHIMRENVQTVEPDLCYLKIKQVRDQGHTRNSLEHLDDACHKYIEEYERLYVRNERY